MDKNSIRAEMRIRRKAVSPEEKSAAEAMICGKLKSHMDTYGTETIVAAYLASQDEICLDSFMANYRAYLSKILYIFNKRLQTEN